MASFEELTDEQRTALARVGHQLFHNPEVSRDAKRLLMKANPKVRFPEIEQDSRLERELKSRDEKIADLEAKQMDADMRSRLEEKRAAARARGLDPAEVEKAVTDKKIMDWDVAMDFVEMVAQSAPATPASDQQKRPILSAKDLWNDPAQWARDKTIAAIDELNKRRRRA